MRKDVPTLTDLRNMQGERGKGGPWVPPTPNQERKDRERIMGRGDWEEGSEEDIM